MTKPPDRLRRSAIRQGSMGASAVSEAQPKRQPSPFSAVNQNIISTERSKTCASAGSIPPFPPKSIIYVAFFRAGQVRLHAASRRAQPIVAKATAFLLRRGRAAMANVRRRAMGLPFPGIIWIAKGIRCHRRISLTAYGARGPAPRLQPSIRPQDRNHLKAFQQAGRRSPKPLAQRGPRFQHGR